MIRLLFILVVAGLVALMAAWIADHDMVLTLTAGSYELRTTVAVAAGLLIVCFTALWLLLRVLFAILSALARTRRLAGQAKTQPVSAHANDTAPQMVPAQDRPSS
jgi:uncharacterized membrane-anchored protein